MKNDFINIFVSIINIIERISLSTDFSVKGYLKVVALQKCRVDLINKFRLAYGQ
jgi:hypothetical protein